MWMGRLVTITRSGLQRFAIWLAAGVVGAVVFGLVGEAAIQLVTRWGWFTAIDKKWDRGMTVIFNFLTSPAMTHFAMLTVGLLLGLYIDTLAKRRDDIPSGSPSSDRIDVEQNHGSSVQKNGIATSDEGRHSVSSPPYNTGLAGDNSTITPSFPKSESKPAILSDLVAEKVYLETALPDIIDQKDLMSGVMKALERYASGETKEEPNLGVWGMMIERRNRTTVAVQKYGLEWSLPEKNREGHSRMRGD